VNQVSQVNAGLPSYDPDAIQAQYEAQRKQAQDIRRNNLDAISNANHPRNYLYQGQPFKYGKPIGIQAYKYLETFKANDGDHYASYQHVRGGDNRKYYNLVTETWENKSEVTKWCNNCNYNYKAMTPGVNKCPNCGAEKDWKY
jgi:hypothetical protein